MERSALGSCNMTAISIFNETNDGMFSSTASFALDTSRLLYSTAYSDLSVLAIGLLNGQEIRPDSLKKSLF